MQWNSSIVTVEFTSARTRVRTFSPISGEMSLPNCCRVVRKRFSLLSCRAPQVAGNCWLVSADDVEEAGPLLNLCGGDGAPLRVGGEWLMPLLNAVGVNDTGLGPPGFIGGRGGMVGGEDLDCIFTSTGDPGIAGTLLSVPSWKAAAPGTPTIAQRRCRAPPPPLAARVPRRRRCGTCSRQARRPQRL